MKKLKKEIIVTGIVCLTFLEMCALFNGIDGTLFAIVVAIIAGAIGVVIPAPKVIT